MISDFFELTLPNIRRHPLLSAAAALSIFAVAFLIRWALQDLLFYRVPFITFFVGVLLVTLTSGPVWGLIILTLCGVSAWNTFFPSGAVAIAATNSVALILFIVFGSFIVGIIHLMNGAFEALSAQRLRANEFLHNSALSEARLEQLNVELRHRTKNLFAVLSALVSQTARVAPTPAVMGDAIRSRLRAMGSAQDLLFQTQYADLGLRDLVVECLAPLTPVGDGRLRAAGPNVKLLPDIATPLALVIHELATNAVKYGSWSNDNGVVTIDWSMVIGAEHNKLNFLWKETGGPASVEPDREGLGSQLIKSGVPGSQTQRHFTDNGLIFEMIVDLPNALNGTSITTVKQFGQP